MLLVKISINNEHLVSHIGIRRLTPKDKPNDDDVCTYTVGRIFDEEVKVELGTLSHRYKDGAEVLTAKAMALVSEHTLTAIEEEARHRLYKISEHLFMDNGI